MTIAYWMLIAAVMMPYLTIALAKSAGGVDNRAPRPSLESPFGLAPARGLGASQSLRGVPRFCGRGVRGGTDARAHTLLDDGSALADAD